MSKVKRLRDLRLKAEAAKAAVTDELDEAIKALGPLKFTNSDHKTVASVNMTDNRGYINLETCNLSETDAIALARWILATTESE